MVFYYQEININISRFSTKKHVLQLASRNKIYMYMWISFVDTNRHCTYMGRLNTSEDLGMHYACMDTN
jgi:hypothetical protein